MPPSPCRASSSTAATRGSASPAARIAAASLYGTWMKPEGRGSKPLRALSLPVAASVARVRPCQDESMVMMWAWLLPCR